MSLIRQRFVRGLKLYPGTLFVLRHSGDILCKISPWSHLWSNYNCIHLCIRPGPCHYCCHHTRWSPTTSHTGRHPVNGDRHQHAPLLCVSHTAFVLGPLFTVDCFIRTGIFSISHYFLTLYVRILNISKPRRLQTSQER